MNNYKTHIIKILLFFSFFVSKKLFSQTSPLKGKIISEYDLQAIGGVRILNSDGNEIGASDFYGNFEINLPSKTKNFKFNAIGMESQTINLQDNKNCSFLEIIMMNDVIYDFISLKKVDRLRMKRYKNLPRLHKKAFKKGIFKTSDACFKQEFIPYNKK